MHNVSNMITKENFKPMNTYKNSSGSQPNKKTNEILKKFLNAQQYSKNLKKKGQNLVEEASYATFSYDEFQSYPQVPQSAKLPSNNTLFSKQLIHSVNVLNNDSEEYGIKAKSKKSHGHINFTQSSNQIPYMKSKKSSYSQMQKSQGNKSVAGSKILLRDPQIKTTKQYDVHSVNKEKYSGGQTLHQSLGGMKTQSFFKLQTKNSFNYSYAHEYESQKLSSEDKKSYQRLNRKTNKRLQDSNNQTDLVRQETKEEFVTPYNLSPSNFIKLINKVQQLQGAIVLYRQALELMKKKINKQQEQIKTNQMNQILIDSIKDQLMQEKSTNAELRQRLHIQDLQIKEYQKVMLQSIEKVSKHYQNELSKITILQKQNQFLKLMLRLQHQQQQNPQSLIIRKNETDKQKEEIKQLDYGQEDSQGSFESKFKLSKNIAQFKDKFNKILSEKNKSQSN